MSPLTCQIWSNTPATSTAAEKRMMHLAGLTHRWLATFFDEDGYDIKAMSVNSFNQQQSLRCSIEQLTYDETSGLHHSESEAMYESCRWASKVLLTVEQQHVPIYVAAQQVQIQPRLRRRLYMTDLSNLWEDRKGLLFWVVAVCHFAVIGRCYALLTTTLFTAFTHHMALSEYCDEIALQPLRRLKLFENHCCDQFQHAAPA
jgi:hypothetical protein